MYLKNARTTLAILISVPVQNQISEMDGKLFQKVYTYYIPFAFTKWILKNWPYKPEEFILRNI